MTVTATAEDIYKLALALPEDERRELAERITASAARFASDEVERAWRDEVLRRLEAVRRGETRLVPWSEVKQSIQKLLGES